MDYIWDVLLKSNVAPGEAETVSAFEALHRAAAHRPRGSNCTNRGADAVALKRFTESQLSIIDEMSLKYPHAIGHLEKYGANLCS